MDLRSLRYFVAVAEELHFGRAAARLHMSQPPLSRCIKELESELGCLLLQRSAAGVRPTPAGIALYQEAVGLLALADRIPDRVTAAAGTGTFALGTIADSAELTGPTLVKAFRSAYPHLSVQLREADLTDPTAGLRAGLVDVALTRLPFDDEGIATRVLFSEPLVAVLPAGDPLAERPSVQLKELADRVWFQLPAGTDPVWRAYWSGVAGPGQRRDGPVVRTVRECLHSVLWNGTVGLMPAGHALPEGIVAVPLTDMAPSRVVVAWTRSNTDPRVRAFVRTALSLRRPKEVSADLVRGLVRLNRLP